METRVGQIQGLLNPAGINYRQSGDYTQNLGGAQRQERRIITITSGSRQSIDAEAVEDRRTDTIFLHVRTLPLVAVAADHRGILRDHRLERRILVRVRRVMGLLQSEIDASKQN